MAATGQAGGYSRGIIRDCPALGCMAAIVGGRGL
jgi:hypothetical protein